MRNPTWLLFVPLIIVHSCFHRSYPTNGETIYKTGRNIHEEKLLDRKSSQIKIAASCRTCHGKNGDALRGVSIKYRDLTNPANFTIPYTDSLFFRFLDQDIKSNGTKANIGVAWKISDTDKRDLIGYLKTL